MSELVEEVRALLAAFVHSPLRDLHLRTGGWEVFLARPNGAANPMTTAKPAEASITASHLGLFFGRLTVGANVEPDTVIGELELLGEREDVLAGRAGRVTAILPADGALVEYGQPLVRLAA
jgi:biotin carboxyl carrier protein